MKMNDYQNNLVRSIIDDVFKYAKDMGINLTTISEMTGISTTTLCIIRKGMNCKRPTIDKLVNFALDRVYGK